MLRESLRMSWQNIRANRMRTFLTMLGIIIGVTAIIALITTVQGATDEITSQFSALGAGRVSVSVTGTPLKRGLKTGDLEKLRAVENVAGIDPTLRMTRPVVAGTTLLEDVRIEGRSDAYFSAGSVKLQEGRALLPEDMDRCAAVCVVDGDLRRELFPNTSPLGEQLIIGGIRYTVVGLLSEDGDNDVMTAMNAMNSGSGNGTAIIPYRSAMRTGRIGSISSLTVYLADTARAQDTQDALEETLNQMFNYKDDAFFVLSLDSLLDTMNTMVGMMTTMLAGIASIALLVGGIGIMNMMLVSVSERTSEIGLRKALGARPRLIQTQFIIESVMLSVMGGIVGILAGNLTSMLLCRAIDIPFKMSADAITLAFTFSAGVGVVFGWAPARKASRLNPIDALRSV